MIRAKDKLQSFPDEPRGLIPSLLSLSTPPLFLHSDPLLRPGTRIPSTGPPGGHPFPVAQTVRPVTSQGLLGPYPLLPHAVPIPRQPEMPSCSEKQPQQPYLSLGGGQSLLGAAPVGVPLRTPRMTFLLERHHEPRGAFMNKVGVGTSLKVTIRRSSENRAFSTRSEEAVAASGLAMDKDMNLTADKYRCYICNVTSLDQHDFQTHMISLGHQQKMMEIQHLSNTCLATLLPKMHQSLQGKHRGLRHWCAVCQCHFTGDLIEHRRTKKHKMAKVSSRPFCTVCERHFRTPRKFVEHMKSPEHKQHVEELKEGVPEVMEELITLDAIGCFEHEVEYEEEVSEDEEAPTASKQINLIEINDDGEYDPDTQYGTNFVVPIAGFLCKLCHRFYHFESRARETHCKSLTHFQNIQKYKAMLNLLLEDDENPASQLGNVENVENSSVSTEEMKDQHEEEEENQLDFIAYLPAGYTKKQHS